MHLYGCVQLWIISPMYRSMSHQSHTELSHYLGGYHGASSFWSCFLSSTPGNSFVLLLYSLIISRTLYKQNCVISNLLQSALCVYVFMHARAHSAQYPWELSKLMLHILLSIICGTDLTQLISPAEGHLGCLYFDILDKAAIHYIQVILWILKIKILRIFSSLK